MSPRAPALPLGFRPTYWENCDVCDGCGTDHIEDYDELGTFRRPVDCTKCNGTGRTPACDECDTGTARYIDDDGVNWCQGCFDERARCWTCGETAVDADREFCSLSCQAEYEVCEAEARVER